MKLQDLFEPTLNLKDAMLNKIKNADPRYLQKCKINVNARMKKR